MISTVFRFLMSGLYLTGIGDEWDRFEKSVRDQQITEDSARTVFPVLYRNMKDSIAGHDFSTSNPWIFPVKGYSRKDAGAGGFKPDIRYGSSPVKGYDFYDGNRHGGHPAYDIFIHDNNRDCLDDKTGKPVSILAPADMIILSAFTEWKSKSEIRGGNYIWALNPKQDMIYYFAHMDSIAVSGSEYCPAGTFLGTMGRTGKNAFPSRSPTHLHLMLLKVKGTELVPYDYWKQLK